MLNNVLDRILQTKKEELANFQLPEKTGFGRSYSLREALIRPRHSLGLIAEVKKASPSKGVFRETLDPAAVGKAYAEAGADAVSVLTDRLYFQGSNNNLIKVKQAVDIPVLRKDFIIDHRQIEESERIGADAILLIAAALDSGALHELYLDAYERGLEVLVEVHNREEAAAVLGVFEPAIMGVNNRDLKTFVTDLGTAAELSAMIPENAVFVSESGVLTAGDVQFLEHHGADAALVGEALVKAESPQKAVSQLFGKEVERHASEA